MRQQFPVYHLTTPHQINTLTLFTPLDHSGTHPFDQHHSHGYHELLFFNTGGGIHNIDFQKHEIKDHSIHLLPAGSIHMLERSMQSEGFVICYKEQFLYKLQEFNPAINFITAFKDARIINMQQADHAGFEVLIRELILHKDHKAYNVSMIGSFLSKVAETFLHPAAPAAYKRPDPAIARLLELINIHYPEKASPSFYAAQLHTTTQALNRKVKSIFGITVAGLQQERTFKEAKKLLCKADRPIKEIAWQLGFEECAHFTNWFKKRSGYTPMHFRNDKISQ